MLNTRTQQVKKKNKEADFISNLQWEVVTYYPFPSWDKSSQLHEPKQISVLLHGWELHLNCERWKEDLLRLTAWVPSRQSSEIILFSWEGHHLCAYMELLVQVWYEGLDYTHTWVSIYLHYWCWHSKPVFNPLSDAGFFFILYNFQKL